MITYSKKKIPAHLQKYFEPAELGLEPTFQEYITKLCDIFDEVKRVLKKDGTCWVNLGDTYGGSNGVGWKETIESTNRKIGGGENKSVKKELGIESGVPKSLCQIPSRFSIEMTNRGWILRNEIIWYKPNCMPSSVKDRFTVDFEKVFFFVKSKKYWFETQYESYVENSDMEYRKTLRCGRKYGVKRPYKDNQPLSYQNKPTNTSNGRNKRCVWRITTKPFKEAHFATFPEDLVETPIKAGCQIGGTVLDPFCGAGTTGVIAKKLKRNFIGIELNPQYLEMAKRRIQNTQENLL